MRIVPTEVVKAIDLWFPWAIDWKQHMAKRNEARFVGVNRLPGLVALIDRVPDELLSLESNEASALLMAMGALRNEVQLVASGAHRDAVEWPTVDDRDCIEMVRAALSKCRDEARSLSGVQLSFLQNPDLEKTLSVDLGSAETALANGEWKAATVIGGSIIEALLLWVVTSAPRDEIDKAITAAVKANTLHKSPGTDHDRWLFFQLIEVAYQLKKISKDSRDSLQPSRNFRNAIHPGVVQRTGIQCDRGTAHTTYGAVFNVIRDLSGTFS
jgi:hypothetical protein